MKSAESLLDFVLQVPDLLGSFVELKGMTDEERKAVLDAAERMDAFAAHLEYEAKQTEIQTLIFPKEKWSRAEAVAWAKDHDFRADKVDETGESFRLRQKDPGRFQRLRTICLTPRDASPSSDRCRVKAVTGPLKKESAMLDALELKGVGELMDIFFLLPQAMEQVSKPDELKRRAEEILSEAVVEFRKAAGEVQALLEGTEPTGEDQPGEEDSETEPSPILTGLTRIAEDMKSFTERTKRA